MTRVTDNGGQIHWFPQKSAIATLDQAPPVQNTWYPVLDTTTGGVEVLYLSLKHDNTDSSALTINMRVTIDGITLTAAADAAGTDNTLYYAYLSPTADELILGTTFYNAGGYTSLKGHSVKVEVRMTGVPGTAEHLYGYVQYLQDTEV